MFKKMLANLDIFTVHRIRCLLCYVLHVTMYSDTFPTFLKGNKTDTIYSQKPVGLTLESGRLIFLNQMWNTCTFGFS